MVTTNVRGKKFTSQTHEGAPARTPTPYQQLKRTMGSCLLWEDNFYENGEAVATRILELAKRCSPSELETLADYGRNHNRLRHAPLMLLASMVLTDRRERMESTATTIIQRPDELMEILSLLKKLKGTDDIPRPIPAPLRRGMLRALNSFDTYQLSKYQKKGRDISLKDVIILLHPDPGGYPNDKQSPGVGPERANLFKSILEGTVEPPLTWEVELSKGKDKKETFRRLIEEKKLGAMAFLRNLRGMNEAGLHQNWIREKLSKLPDKAISRVLPFRYIAAAVAAPWAEAELEQLMFRRTADSQVLMGDTAILVDCSGSMTANLSSKGTMTCNDAACGLAMLLRETCENILPVAYGTDCEVVPPRRGFALRDAIRSARVGHATYIGRTIDAIWHNYQPDRMIVVTDEQSHDVVPQPNTKLYIVNVQPYKRGVGYNRWVQIDGWSDSIIEYIRELETQ